MELLNLITWDHAALGAASIAIILLHMKSLKLTRELHEWHDKVDKDGVKVWYSRNSGMEKALERLASSIETQTLLLTRLVERMEVLDRDIRREGN